MIDLLELRAKIDDIDGQIVKLYEERMKVSEQVVKFKIGTGKPVFDKERENQKIEAVKELVHSDFNKTGIEELFSHIMSISRKRQYQLLEECGKGVNLAFDVVDKLETEQARVVFQGVEGAYSNAAMNEYFRDGIISSHVETFRDAMEAIKQKKADFAVLPIENSSAGSVIDIYDLLAEYDNYIVGEQVIEVEHVLLGTQDSDLSKIQTVYSHPQALMQCKKYLEGHREWRQVPFVNTAAAAKKVEQDMDRSQAAIASKFAGEFYHLKVLAENIYFSGTNSTRFIIVTNKKMFIKGAGKISICFEGLHETGSLYGLLSHFIYNGLNMSKIESRPIEGKDWEYHFFIDFEGSLRDPAVKNALLGLSEEALNLKILGNY
jgi:chorismate mutase/prephenate dehydratase